MRRWFFAHDELAAAGRRAERELIRGHGRDVHAEAIGEQRLGDGAPMTRDTIFRIASMTKPMAAAVAMMLVEDGVLGLDAPVDRWLPELANRRVLKRIDGPLEDTVPAKRAITVRDVLTFRMGFGIVWGPPNALPIQRATHELHLGAFGPPRVQEPPAPDEWMRRFSTALHGGIGVGPGPSVLGALWLGVRLRRRHAPPGGQPVRRGGTEVWGRRCGGTRKHRASAFS